MISFLDIDECKPQQLSVNHSHLAHNCNQNGHCINTIGSYDCGCNPGYSGNGFTCFDIDECQPHNLSANHSHLAHNCDQNGHCINNIGSYDCGCNLGYSGNGFTCLDINECAVNGLASKHRHYAHNCHNDSICTNTNGSFYCTCMIGYTGNGVNCTDIDECSSGTHKCHEDAICTNTKGSYTCQCMKGYSGNGYNCSDVDECTDHLDNCHDDAFCTNTKGSFNCECLHGYQGDGVNCTDINECVVGTHNCSKDAECINTKGLFNCTCLPGYNGTGYFCKDINECLDGSHDCHVKAECFNFNGTFQCNCTTGYIGNGTYCTDLDECTTNSHNCEGTSICINNIGSFICTCHPGFRYNGVDCLDIDECTEKTHNCHPQFGICKNTAPFFNCTCALGSKGNGVKCEALERVFRAVFRLSSTVWREEYRDKQTSQFKSLSKRVQEALKDIYGDVKSYIGSGVERMLDSNGMTEVEVKMIFSSNPSLPTKPLLLAVKRGNVGTLEADMTDFNVQGIAHWEECPTRCSVDAFCSRNESLFKCICNKGYMGDGTVCIDQNECSVGNGGCEHRCINSPVGSYHCSCNTGFVLDTNRKNCKVSPSHSDISAYCPAEWKQDVLWSATVSGNSRIQFCPDPLTGQASRECYRGVGGGVWGVPDMTRCITDPMKKLKAEIDNEIGSNRNPTFPELALEADKLFKVINPDKEKIYAGDVHATLTSLNQIVDAANATDANATNDELTQFVTSVVKAGSGLLEKGNREAWNGMAEPALKAEELIHIVDNLSSVIAKRQEQITRANVINDPDLFTSLSLKSFTDNIFIDLLVVEMTTFKGAVLPNITTMELLDSNVTLDIQDTIYYPDTLFTAAIADKTKHGFYTSLGCYADKEKERAIPTMEGTHAILMDKFLVRKHAVDKCAQVAKSRGWYVFAIQDGGWCASSATAHITYNKYGVADNCVAGKGGMFANDVYIVDAYYATIQTVFYKNLGDLMTYDPLEEVKLRQKSGLKAIYNTTRDNSIVISGRVIDVQDKFFQTLENPVELVFQHLDMNDTARKDTRLLCSYLNMNSNRPQYRWLQDGCTSSSTNWSHTVCQCSHLTNFQLLVEDFEPKEIIDDYHQRLFKLLSYISCGISASCCVAACLVYTFLQLMSDRAQVLKNFAFNIAIAQLIFQLGAHQTQDKVLCKGMGILLHFFLTAMFSWALVEAWDLYALLLQAYTNTKRTDVQKRYYILGYGLPTAITALSMAVFWNDYGGTDICWFSHTVLVSLFIPPIAAIVLTTIIILGMVTGVLISPDAVNKRKDAESGAALHYISSQLKLSLVLLPLIAVTWVIGFVQITSDSIALSYIFVVLNASHGVFFFANHVLLNFEVNLTFKKRFLKHLAKPDDRSYGMRQSSLSPTDSHRPSESEMFSSAVSKAKAYNDTSFSKARSKRLQRQGPGSHSSQETYVYDSNEDVKNQWRAVNEM